jgi:hypothetical protein
MLEVIEGFFEDGTNPKLATAALIEETALWSLGQCERILQTDQGDESALKNSAISLVTLLDAFGRRVFHDAEFAAVSVSSHFLGF